MIKVFILLQIFFLLPFSAFAEDGPLVPLQQKQSASGPMPPLDIHDIYPLVPVVDPVNWTLIALIGLALLLLLALVIAILFLKKKKRAPQIPVIPAHETALAELEKARRYIEDNESIHYANTASEILRTYIEKRFFIHSTRQTTMEFLSYVDRMTASPAAALSDHRQHLAECLQHCDLAKYAHRNSTREALQDLEGRIRHFIVDTAEKETV